MRGGRWGRGGGDRRGGGQPRGRGSRGWSRGGGIASDAVPVVNLRLDFTPEPAGQRGPGDFLVTSPDCGWQMSEPKSELELWAAVQPEPEPDDSSSSALDPKAPAYVAELNPQAAEFRYQNPSAGQHLMAMLQSSAPREQILPGPPDIGQQPREQARSPGPARALPAPPPRRVVYRTLDESDRRAVKRALAHHLDPGELLTAPCEQSLLLVVSAAAAAA